MKSQAELVRQGGSNGIILALYKGFDDESHAKSFGSCMQQNCVKHYSEMIGVAKELMQLHAHQFVERDWSIPSKESTASASIFLPSAASGSGSWTPNDGGDCRSRSRSRGEDL